jgi:hypothetical protein
LIVDAVDEDERLEAGREAQEIFERLEDLGPAGRDRLHVLFFCRENEVPPHFEQSLERIFGESLRRFRLAGLDRESARDLVGVDRFADVCRQIEAGSLQGIAALPVVLEHLASRSLSETLDPPKLWRGVLMDLLRDSRGRARLPAHATEVDDRFEVVQWLAAVLTFSGWAELSLDAPNLTSPSLEQLVPRELKVLREAAREAAVRTSVFERSEENRFRFAQDHVRQWFAAFALKDQPLLRIRPLLTDEAGHPNRLHEGVMDILARITDQAEVKDWIDAVHGGVLPPSGSVPWTLVEVARALDKLQDLARGAPWGLDLWREERLAELAVPGAGAEVARRLASDLATEEQELLFDVALAIGAPEPLDAAVRIVQDRRQDRRVRALAAEFIARVAEREQLEPLERWARTLATKDADADDVLSTLAASFFKSSLWDFDTTADFAMSRQAPGNEWLQHVLAEEMTLLEARRTVAKALDSVFLFRAPLVRKAFEQVSGQDALTEPDADLLIPLAMRQEEIDENREYGLPNLGRILAKHQIPRRKLFLAGLREDPERKRRGWWIWRSVLQGEDMDWLLEVIEERGGEPAWLWETMYLLSCHRGTSRAVLRRIRNVIQSYDVELLRRLDKEKKIWKRQEARDRQWRERGEATYELIPLIREMLVNEDVDLHIKMLRISQLCFPKTRARPNKLRGGWEDLDEEMRLSAGSVCRRALLECTPTVIPTSQSFPAAIQWEAACFAFVLNADPGIELSAGLIRKWLPAVLRCWEDEWKPVLWQCVEIDRQATEDLIVEAILREVQIYSGTAPLAQHLTIEIWSERLALALESAIVENPEAPLVARLEILDRIGRVFPSRAAEIALRWVKESNPANRQIQEGGINILLAVNPPEGWRLLKELMRNEAPAVVLTRMTALLAHYAGPKADLESWPPELLHELASCLHETFPDKGPEKLPGRAYSHERESDLRDLLDAIPRLLFHRRRDGDEKALEQLAREHEEVGFWLEQTRAQSEADGLLSGTGFLRGEVPVDRVVRLLMDARYRLTRTADDLLDLVLEELRSISRDVKHHLGMLYKGAKGEQRSHLPEDALQAYLHCRLRDRMSSGYLEPQPKIVFINREPLAARNTRNDLKIEALSFDGKPLTLIIEIKWSDNRDVSTSQVDQLGKDYLVASNITHGIYLVGWCGKSVPWKDRNLPAPEPRSSPEAWRTRLMEQAALFEQKHPGFRIEPFILDLVWDTTADGPSA